MTDLNSIVHALNETGWRIVDARLEAATCVAQNSAKVRIDSLLPSSAPGVTLALVESGFLTLTLDGKDGGNVLLQASVLDVRAEGEPWDVISIHGPKVRTERKKKEDGGGLRHVAYDGLLLRLVNHERHNARIEAKRKADEAARAKAQAEAVARRQEEGARRDAERRLRAQSLLDDLRKRIAGATITDIAPTARCNGVIITFSDGREAVFSAIWDGGYDAEFHVDQESLSEIE